MHPTRALPSGISWLLVASTLAAGSLTACGGGDGPSDPPTPVTVSISPTTATLPGGGTQDFTASVANGSTSDVTWTTSGGVLSGSGNSRTYTAPASGGPFTVTATSVADPTKSASATVTIAPVAVAVTPATVTVGAGATQQFTATVTNAANTAVTWTTTGGTIEAMGTTATLTAPVAGGQVTVRATSVADPTKSGSATVTVTPAQVVVTPATQAVMRGEPITLTAAVTGAAEAGVTWATSCGALTVNGATATWTAPNAAGDCTVTATSTADPTKNAVATLTVRPVARVAATDDADDGECSWSHCSLREALAMANAAPDVDTVSLVAPAGRGARAATLALTRALPAISTPVHIVGPGSSLLTIDAGASEANPRRVISFQGAPQGTLAGVTVRGGVAQGGGGVALTEKSDVALRDVVITANQARGGAGGGLLINDSRAQLESVVIAENQVFGANIPGGGLNVANGSVVTMVGGSVTNNTVNQGGAGGVRVVNASLAMTDVDVTGNRTLAGGGGGGGMQAEGATSTVQLTNVTLSSNETVGDGGGLRLATGATAEIRSSTISGNTSRNSGGGIAMSGSGAVTLTAVDVRGNRVTGDQQHGGGIVATGATASITWTGGELALNETTNGVGGGLFGVGGTYRLADVVVRANAANGCGGSGGGLNVVEGGRLEMTGGSVRENRANVVGGGMVIFNATGVVDGTSVAGNTANGQGGGIQVSQASNATFTNVAVTDNTAGGGAGGIGVFHTSALTMTGGEVSRNRATGGAQNTDDFGGGISKNSTGAFSVTGTRIADNVAGQQGGGMQLVGTGAVTLQRVTVSGNTSETGGGGVTLGFSTSLIESSTFSGNTTGATATGGGLFSSSTATTTVRNSTFSGNQAGTGGAIGATGAISIVGATIVANTAGTLGGGIVAAFNSVMQIGNTLLSANTTAGANGNCGTSGAGAITSNGHNLSDQDCPALTSPNDRNGTPAGVNATLANNGGPTFTHALQAGSAAIDAGGASCPTTDQRGAPRVGTCDIGAFEFGATAPAGSLSIQRTAAIRSAPASARAGSRPSAAEVAELARKAGQTVPMAIVR